MPARVSQRSTSDVVVLVAVLTLALVVLLAGAAIFTVLVWVPERDASVLIAAYGNLIGAVLGGFLGYAAGRGQPHRAGPVPATPPRLPPGGP